jgi:hypothetical protein
VLLSDGVNATVLDGQGECMILDDDCLLSGLLPLSQRSNKERRHLLTRHITRRAVHSENSIDDEDVPIQVIPIRLALNRLTGAMHVSGDFSGALVLDGIMLSSVEPNRNGFVAELNPFDTCIQDDANGNLLQFNSVSGDYLFSSCRKGFRLSGKGVVTTRACKIELRDTGPDARRPDRNVSALANPCTRVGTVSLQVFSPSQTFAITDSNIGNNTCSCR